MAFRFRRSVKLAPGLRMNFSKSGIGFSAGRRGASISVGPRGAYSNVGVPGTGISYRTPLTGSPGRASRQRTAALPETTSVKLLLMEDGNVVFCDEAGSPLASAVEQRVKKNQGDVIRAWLAAECQKFTGQVDSLDRVHLATPPPDQPLPPQPRTFSVEPPVAPIEKPIGILGWLFRRVRDRIEKENETAKQQYSEALRKWEEEKATFEAAEAARHEVWEQSLRGEIQAMQQVLEARLAALEWPRETTVSFDIPDPSTVLLDVDLPEIEDLPTRTASVPSRGWRLSMKPLSERRVRDMYMRHVHGIAIRIAGEVLAALPTVQNLILSGYSQRPHAATGRLEDQYLYSVRIDRVAWQRVDFSNLADLDPVEALNGFELRRDLSRSAVFRAIVPFAAGSVDSQVDR